MDTEISTLPSGRLRKKKLLLRKKKKPITILPAGVK